MRLKALPQGPRTRYGVAVILMVLCLGCTAPQPPAGSGEEPAAGQPKSGGYLRHLLPYSAQSLDPYTTEEPTGYGFISFDWFDGLVKVDYRPGEDWRIETRVVPSLAESWKQEDKNSYLFNLRKDVQFHSGDPFTADDVVFSYRRFLDPNEKIHPQVRRFLVNLGDAEKVDEHTVRVTTKQPDADFLVNLAQRNVVILSKKFVDGGGDLKKQAVGTGPFRLTSYRTDADALATRSPNYWEKGRPYLDGIKMTLRVDDSTMSAAFAAKQADILMRSDKNEAAPILAANPAARFVRLTTNTQLRVGFNVKKRPFDDVRVRRAIHIGMDREEINKATSFGEGVLTAPLVQAGKKGWTIPDEELLQLPGYRQPKEQDVAEAKRLLAQAGHGSGLRLNFMYNQGYTRYPGEAQVVAAQLNKSGFQISLEPKETAVAQKAEADGDFTMTFAQFRYEADGPDWPFWLHSKQAKARVGIDDAGLDRLIDEQYRELDEGKRKRMWTDLQRLLLDKLYVVPLITQTGFIAYQPYAHGWGDNRAGQAVNLAWENTWVESAKLPAGR